jgi:hypothetical protein
VDPAAVGRAGPETVAYLFVALGFKKKSGAPGPAAAAVRRELDAGDRPDVGIGRERVLRDELLQAVAEPGLAPAGDATSIQRR